MKLLVCYLPKIEDLCHSAPPLSARFSHPDMARETIVSCPELIWSEENMDHNMLTWKKKRMFLVSIVSCGWPFGSELEQIGNDSFEFSLVSPEKHYCKLYLSRSVFFKIMNYSWKTALSHSTPAGKVLHCLLKSLRKTKILLKIPIN